MRTFVAVEISNSKVIENISRFQTELKINGKQVEPHNLHFTLQFLGDIPENQAEKVKEALQEIEFFNFIVNFKGVGAFPKMKYPRVIWIGTDEKGGNEMVDLAEKVENKLAPLGFKSDKPFKPHITIFRIKNKVGDITKELQKFESLEFGMQEIKNFKFKQSILTPNGPVYSDLIEIGGKK